MCGVSFEIAEGEVFGLLGPNGAGKTTTMRMLGTLLSPTSGTATVPRIDLACGLVHRPKLLFLDEPTTGVDPASRAALWSELGRLRESGVSLFLTTHYLEEADRLCERLAIVDRGIIVAEGTPDELKAGIGADVVTVTVDSSEVVAARAALEALGRLRSTRAGERRDRGDRRCRRGRRRRRTAGRGRHQAANGHRRTADARRRPC